MPWSEWCDLSNLSFGAWTYDAIPIYLRTYRVAMYTYLKNLSHGISEIIVLSKLILSSPETHRNAINAKCQKRDDEMSHSSLSGVE